MQLFFGSIQIIQYLKNNEVQLNESLWLYAIHSQNAELISFLESNKVGIDIRSALKEAIYCHHNDIASYIKDNYIYNLTDPKNEFEIIDDYLINSKNLYFCEQNLLKSFSNLFLKPKNPTSGSSSQVNIFFSYIFKRCFHLVELKFVSSSSANSNKILIPSLMTSKVSFGLDIGREIESIEITGKIEQIPSCLYFECQFLQSITIETSSPISFDNECFYNCYSLYKVTINSTESSSSTTENEPSCNFIGINSFGGCSSLTKIIIPSFITEIKKFAFRSCRSLTQIEIPSSVTSIKEFAFLECSSLKQIIIPSSITSINKNVFCRCSSLTQITIPSSVVKIEQQAFEGCSSLTQIIIPSSVVNIEHEAFKGCSSLTQIIIPASVTKIGNGSFSGCSSLKQIAIPSSITEIEEKAFSGCL